MLCCRRHRWELAVLWWCHARLRHKRLLAGGLISVGCGLWLLWVSSRELLLLWRERWRLLHRWHARSHRLLLLLLLWLSCRRIGRLLLCRRHLLLWRIRRHRPMWR